MKKFKLIEAYPESPALGTEIFDNGSCWQTDSTKQCQPHFFRQKTIFNPENFPKNWQEVIEKDYEILTFTNIDNNLIYVKFGVRFMNGYSTRSIEYCRNYYKIHSVKRLSDGKVFTVGDNTSFGKILAFDTPGSDKSECRYKIDNSGNGWRMLKNACKLLLPLFKTEDGVEIFEGDVFAHTSGSTEPKVVKATCKHLNYSLPMDKLFSSYQKAEEYVLMNTQCLSVNEIFNVIQDERGDESFSNSNLGRMLKQLAKKKIRWQN